jgi:hypothetical protein
VRKSRCRLSLVPLLASELRLLVLLWLELLRRRRLFRDLWRRSFFFRLGGRRVAMP